MNFGVIITRGACPWQIFPQGPDGTAPIHLEGTYHLIHLSQELPLSFSQAGPPGRRFGRGWRWRAPANR